MPNNSADPSLANNHPDVQYYVQHFWNTSSNLITLIFKMSLAYCMEQYEMKAQIILFIVAIISKTNIWQ